MITLFNFAWIRIEKGAGGNSVTCQVIMEFTVAIFFQLFYSGTYNYRDSIFRA
jgi:hypothetical protein